MTRKPACLLCGADAGEITVSLVEWREPVDHRRWQDLPRCRDAEACWTRVVAALGEEWQVNDGRPARAPTPPPDEPLQAAETPAADAPQEDPEWLTR